MCVHAPFWVRKRWLEAERAEIEAGWSEVISTDGVNCFVAQADLASRHESRSPHCSGARTAAAVILAQRRAFGGVTDRQT